MSDWKKRLKETLEPILCRNDPRPEISAYNDVPYAIFTYPPEDEFDLRKEISLLKNRLETRGKRVTVISLAECLYAALESEGMDIESIAEAEKNTGIEAVIETIHEVLSSYQSLDGLIVKRMPADSDPLRDILFITRAGSLFPMYRTSPLLEQLKGKVLIPGVLFYPGRTDGAAGLSFMGILDAEHNYRVKIF